MKFSARAMEIAIEVVNPLKPKALETGLKKTVAPYVFTPEAKPMTKELAKSTHQPW